ncbi:MAG: hypothetical protein ABSF72_14750 [Candidatus Sulfotelmatobacter sp.]|jgi:hypothetical protein
MIEPRMPIWALADVFWQNEAGALCVTRGTLEDTSRSGACVRVDRPIEVGSKVTIKWHREQFCAITKNIRSDGRQFLLGLRREGDALPLDGSEPAAPEAISMSPESVPKTQLSAAPDAMVPPPAQSDPSKPGLAQLDVTQLDRVRTDPARPAPNRSNSAISKTGFPKASQSGAFMQSFSRVQSKDGHEGKIMASKSLFSWFSRREEGADAVDKTQEKEKQSSGTGNTITSSKLPLPNGLATGPRGDLLSCEDIYRAAGILGSRSGYDIDKVVEMLHSDRLGGLADDARHSLVLMAIEAAGNSPDDLLHEASEREGALNAYEANQRRHMEEYEARKTRENGQIEAEMARITAHYAERMKANLDQVAREKGALRNWQMSKQGESQRITEVMELCAKPEASALRGAAMAATSDASSGGVPVNASGASPVGPSENRSHKSADGRVAPVATRREKNVVRRKSKRTHLTPTGLLMEVVYTPRKSSPRLGRQPPN